MSSFVSPPPHWKVVKLGDIANVEFSSVDKKAADGEIPVVLCNYHDVVNNYRIRSGIDFMPATATAKEVDKWTLQQDDVIFTKDAEIGKVSLVEESLPNLVCGYHLGRARPKSNVVDGPFLAEALKTYDVQKQFTQLQTGLTISGIRLDDTKSIKVLLPSLDEQKNIASVLNDFERTIEQTENVIIKTAQLRDSLLYELLTRGLPGRHKEWKEVSDLGIIPTSWQVVRLSDISEIITGNTPPRANKEYYGGQVPWVKPSDLRSHYVSKSDEYLTTKGITVARLVPEGSVLVSCIGTVGEVAIAKIPLCFNQQINALIPNNAVLSSFLFWSISHRTKYIQSIAPKTAVPILNKKEFSQIRISLPSLFEQEKIMQYLDSIDTVLENNICIIRIFRRLSESLRNNLLKSSFYKHPEEMNK